MEGVYVVSPTVDSVDAIKRDFSSPAEALYRAVHLFFLERVPDDVLLSIKQCPALVSRLKTFKASFPPPKKKLGRSKILFRGGGGGELVGRDTRRS